MRVTKVEGLCSSRVLGIEEEKVQKIGVYFAGSVALITFILYLPVLQNAFIKRDDIPYILANRHIRSFDVALLKWAFFYFYSANWHPLTWIFHALDYALWGLNPLGHHLTSIILHSVNACLVVFLVIKLLEAWKARTKPGGPSPFLNERSIFIAAAATGLLFGLHPLHVESVAWASEKKDLLCALFFLLSITMYTKYAGAVNVEANNTSSTLPIFNKYYLFSIGFFVLALLSKPMAVSLPFVLLILDWYPFKRIHSYKPTGMGLIEKLPFIVFSLVSAILTVMAQRAGMAMQLMNAVPLSKREIVAAKSLISYLWKIILPINLTPFYPYPKDISLSSADYILTIAFVIGMTMVCMAYARRRKLLLATWGYYVVILIPVLGIVQVGDQSMADRYTYLPSIGLFLIVGLAAAWVLRKTDHLSRPHLVRKVGGSILIFSMFIALSFLTFKQIGTWRNNLTLWSHVIETEPEPPLLAYTSRSMDYFNMGQFEKAIADFSSVISLDPSSFPAYLYRGMAFHKIGQVNKAIEDYNKAIALNPYSVDAYINRSMAFGDMGRPNKAIEDCDKAISLDPSNYLIYNNKGAFYGKLNMPGKAIEAFSKSIAIAPNSADSYYNRGVAYTSLGEYEKALEDFSNTIELNQSDALAYFSRGLLYLRTGKKELAILDFRKACDLGNMDGCKALNKSLSTNNVPPFSKGGRGG
ncbi:MAG: tetratricopeptide repeat protein [bacterium]